MHFWRAPDDSHGGDLVYFQGHSLPGIYARAFLEGRLSDCSGPDGSGFTDGNGPEGDDPDGNGPD